VLRVRIARISRPVERSYLWAAGWFYGCADGLTREDQCDFVNQRLDISRAGAFGPQLAELGQQAGMLRDVDV
jgi:hypothetical protein